MVVTKHFATHGKKYRRRLIKYILNPDKTDNLKLVSDFGMSNYLDFPSYEEMVEMYNVNFTNNDKLYEYRNDRQEKHQQNIHAHHLIQSFSPEDNLTPEEINRIGYETIMELTGGRFRFIVATHTDKDHIHNHILINAIDCNSDKKLIWNYALERNLRMISDRISKMAGAKIIEKRFSYRDYQKYRATSHKKVYIRETTSYFVYNKEHLDKNQYIKGRTLIRQLTNDSRVIPYRRPTVERLQEKISEISLLIELTETDKKYQDIKDNLVSEIAELDIKLTQTNEKIATLNKMAEVLIDSKSEGSGSQKLARHEFSKLNMTESTTLEQVNEELLKLQQEFGNVLDEYEKTIRKLGQLFKVFDECINKEIMNEI
ncbi:relaxase/mobilization nuclease domain-containing protein [Streptococcus pneumoniae]|nr:relaxase/mobilization nuclease domain-containing protein [Streptococcus pneumoniae]